MGCGASSPKDELDMDVDNDVQSHTPKNNNLAVGIQPFKDKVDPARAARRRELLRRRHELLYSRSAPQVAALELATAAAAGSASSSLNCSGVGGFDFDLRGDSASISIGTTLRAGELAPAESRTLSVSERVEDDWSKRSTSPLATSQCIVQLLATSVGLSDGSGLQASQLVTSGFLSSSDSPGVVFVHSAETRACAAAAAAGQKRNGTVSQGSISPQSPALSFGGAFATNSPTSRPTLVPPTLALALAGERDNAPASALPSGNIDEECDDDDDTYRGSPLLPIDRYGESSKKASDSVSPSQDVSRGGVESSDSWPFLQDDETKRVYRDYIARRRPSLNTFAFSSLDHEWIHKASAPPPTSSGGSSAAKVLWKACD